MMAAGESPFILVAGYALIPTIAMLVGSLSLLGSRKISSFLLHVLQHFAAGVLLCAVATELLPPIVSRATHLRYKMWITLGFTLGVLVMISLGWLTEYLEDDGEDGPCEAQPPTTRTPGGGVSRARAASRGMAESTTQTSVGESIDSESKMAQYGSASLDSAAEAGLGVVVVPTPWATVLAIEIDSLIDGFLLGISYVVGQEKTMLVLAVAIAIEMGFVGVAYSGMLAKLPYKRKLPLLLAAPATIFAGAILGHALSSAVYNHPALHIALLSFGSSALLYLVCEELLIEAHNSGEEAVRECLDRLDAGSNGVKGTLMDIRAAVKERDNWKEDVFFFVGFLFSLMLGAGA